VKSCHEATVCSVHPATACSSKKHRKWMQKVGGAAQCWDYLLHMHLHITTTSCLKNVPLLFFKSLHKTSADFNNLWHATSQKNLKTSLGTSP